MKILAIDPGSTCGWAIDGRCGTWDIRPWRGESAGMRYIRLRGHLHHMLEAYPDLGLIVYEQAHHRGGAATEYAVGCVATIQAWCAEAGVDHAHVHAATVKKHATGKGNAPKALMLGTARRRWPDLEIRDDNAADALWIWDWARGEWGD